MEFPKFKKPNLPNLSRKQIFSLLVFLFFLITLPLAVFLVQQQQIYQQKAVGPEASPTNVKITNLHGGGFSVSWTSVHPQTGAFQETTGSVFWGTDQNNQNQEVFDDRGQDISSTTHHVSIFNLNPNTNYYFKIKSGPDFYGLNVAGTEWVKGGTAKEQPTPISLDPTGNPQPIYGFIKNQAGNKVAGALVYVRLKKDDSNTYSAWMSTVTKTNEGWVMDTKNTRKPGLGSFFDFDGDDRVLIDVQAGQNGIASANFAINQCSPAQDITVVPPTVTPTPTGTVTPTPTPTPTPSGCSSGLTYPSNKWDRIWCDRFLNTKLADRPDRIIITFNQNWGAGKIAGIRSDNIGFLSGRTINLPQSGNYKFSLGSDDGSRLWIDSQLIIDMWKDQSYKIQTVQKYLSAGNHQFRIDWYENTGEARVSFTYKVLP